jgi:hypothetical protein
MAVPTSEVGYTSATTGRGDHEVHKGHVVALTKERKKESITFTSLHQIYHYIKQYPIKYQKKVITLNNLN